MCHNVKSCTPVLLAAGLEPVSHDWSLADCLLLSIVHHAVVSISRQLLQVKHALQ
jgi:hypothetical protein